MKTRVTTQDHLSQVKGYYIGEEGAFNELETTNKMIIDKQKNFIGYPCNADFKLEKFLKWWDQSSLSKCPMNDVGNPDVESSYALNARAYEKKVIQFFADLFSINPYWGYISSGGTQSNEQGLYMGRKYLSKYGRPILYFSEEAHYSIASLGKVLGIESCVIKSQPNGEMDYKALKKMLQPNRPALFSLSIGTTFKGGIDKIEIIQQIVKKKGVRSVYYHADAALFGGYLPFLPDPAKPDLNFKKYPYDSIAISGHKFFGSPVPLGVFLSRREHLGALDADFVEYIDTHNYTIPCSRSSLNTLIFWWTISTTPISEFVHQTVEILKNAKYLYEELKKRNYPVWLNPYSNTVYFKAPSSRLCKKWVLALMTCKNYGPLAHAIILQHVDKPMIDHFVEELAVDHQLGSI